MTLDLKPTLIYIVAVNCGPVVWAVECEICDDIVSEETTDGNLADQYEFEHRKLHNYWEGWEGFDRSDENEES